MGTKITTTGLRKFNFIMAGLHAAQGLAVLVLSKEFTLPVNGSYLTLDSATNSLQPAQTNLFDMHIAWLLAGFFGLSALAHLSIATVYNKTYNSNLQKGINKARWVEYSLSASVMIVAIAMLVGVYDACSLIMLFTLTAVMNLLGLAMEVTNLGRQKPRWITFWIGSLAGIVPWVVIAFYIALSSIQGSSPPAFVYWIFVSIFLFFNCFAVNMFLQYKKIGPWKNYLYGERAYIILSLVAKSLLAWQVFAGTLRP